MTEHRTPTLPRRTRPRGKVVAIHQIQAITAKAPALGTYVDTMELTHSDPEAKDVLLAHGPQIVESTAGGPLRTVKPFTPEVRTSIDYELVDKSIDFMRRQKTAGKPFFLYLPF